MTQKWILRDNDLILAAGFEIGGKALNLRKLKSAGFNVPEFMVIPNQSVQKLKALTNFPDTFLTELSENVGNNFCLSVRSSVSDEDGLNSSFAGMMTSVLNVKGMKSLITAIQTVIRSADSELVQNYRKNQNAENTNIGMGVILQQMVQSEVSGVLFTAHPTTGNREQMCLSASMGLGEGVVSGLADCDEWDFDWKNSKEISERISKKEKTVVSKGNESGVEVREVSNSQQNQSCLTFDQRKEIYQAGLKISKLYSWPQDIEWSWAGGKLVLLQSRPITAKSLMNAWGEPGLFLNNSNIQESFCGLTLPLTFSFASEAYRQVYNQSLKLMNFAPSEIQKHNLRHSRMLAVVQGQVYYNIWSWYEGLLILPSFGKNKADMEKMMGLENPLAFVQNQDLTGIEKLQRVPHMIKMITRLVIKFAGIKKHVNTFLNDFDAKYKKFERSGLFLKTETELFDLIHHYKTVFMENWSTPILNDFYVMMNNGKVMRVLERLNLSDKYPELLMGEKLESTEHTKRLIRLSKNIHQKSFGSALLQSAQSLADLKDQLQGLAPELFADLEDYLYRYGDRVPGELKLETLSSFQDGSFVLDCLKNLSQHQGIEDLEEKELRLRAQAEKFVFQRIKETLGLMTLLSFKSSLKKLRYGIQAREAMRLQRTRSFGVFRALYSEIGVRWSQRQITSDARDIFYLTESEIEDAFYGKSFLIGLQDLIDLKKKTAASYQNSNLEGSLELTQPVVASSLAKKMMSKISSGDKVQGIGCFPGQVTSQVCRMPELDSKKQVDGKILATVRTDPGWAPLFPRIKALLVERGSRLSHSAIVARELGIPTIVNLPNLMNWIQDEEVLHMDGETGTIRKEHGTQRNAGASTAVSKD